MVTLADKINLLLEERGLLKRDLARALDISPQTATDICKGRSAVTIPHLRNLIRFFHLRADYWMDEDRLEPTAADESSERWSEKVHEVANAGLFRFDNPAAVFGRLLQIAIRHRNDYVETFGPLSADERQALGLPTAGEGGRVGRVQAGDED